MGEPLYPTYIVNEATWNLYLLNAKDGETYEAFLKRAHQDDIDAVCRRLSEIENRLGSLNVEGES